MKNKINKNKKGLRDFLIYMEKEKKKRTFGDLKTGNSIYLLNGLEVKELKITRISSTSLYENSVCLETDGGPDQDGNHNVLQHDSFGRSKVAGHRYPKVRGI